MRSRPEHNLSGAGEITLGIGVGFDSDVHAFIAVVLHVYPGDAASRPTLADLFKVGIELNRLVQWPIKILNRNPVIKHEVAVQVFTIARIKKLAERDNQRDIEDQDDPGYRIHELERETDDP